MKRKIKTSRKIKKREEEERKEGKEQEKLLLCKWVLAEERKKERDKKKKRKAGYREDIEIERGMEEREIERKGREENTKEMGGKKY